MPRLPDRHTFGARPTPRPSTFVAGRHGQETAEAEALGQLGQAISGFADTYNRVEDQRDLARAEDAYNQLLNRQSDLTIGEDGFSNKKGADAANTDLIKDYGDRFGSAVSEINEGLSTPRQRRYFDQRAKIAGLQYKQDLISHTTQQTEIYQDEVFGATLTTEERSASLRWANQKGIDTSLVRTNASIDEQGDRRGWSPEKIAEAKFIQGSKIHTGVIQQAINSKAPEYARTYFNKNKDSIDPELYDDIERIIGDTSRDELIQSIGDDAERRGIRLNDALDEVRKKYSGDEEKDIVAGLNARYRDTQAAAADAAWNIYAETGSIRAVRDNIGIWDRLSGQQKAQFRAKAKADRQGGVKTGGGDYYELRKLIQSNPLQFKQLDLNRFVLAPGDRKELIKYQTDDAELGSASTRNQIVNQTVASLGLDPGQSTKTGTTGDRVRGVIDRITEEIQLESLSKGGRKLNVAEIQEISDRFQIKVLREKPWWFDEEIPVGLIEIPEIPKDEVDELAAFLQRHGAPVTEANIIELYNKKSAFGVPELIRRPD